MDAHRRFALKVLAGLLLAGVGLWFLAGPPILKRIMGRRPSPPARTNSAARVFVGRWAEHAAQGKVMVIAPEGEGLRILEPAQDAGLFQQVGKAFQEVSEERVRRLSFDEDEYLTLEVIQKNGEVRARKFSPDER